MPELLVFDPAMCCSTGVCGSEVDPALVRFAADIEWLAGRGAAVRRFNLAQDAAVFAANATVRATLQREGTDCLPLVLVDGEVVSRGRLPHRAELAAWSGVPGETESIYSEAVAELVALGAAVATHSEFGFHDACERARKLGVSDADLRRAVDTAVRVKGVAARHIRELADEALPRSGSALAVAPAPKPALVPLGGGGECKPGTGCC